MAESYPDQEPAVQVKRQILEQRRDQFRQQGYQHAISEKVALRLGDARQAEQARKLSSQSYEAAKLCDEEMQALGAA